jgi:hypothetical protein
MFTTTNVYVALDHLITILFSALKVANGSYIMNGEFAVSPPGTYEAAGARFVYTRADKLDNVFAHGPIHDPIDIMVCIKISVEQHKILLYYV